MTRSFIGFGQRNYIGVLQPFPNYLVPNSYIIPAFINWNAYSASTTIPNINILCDMSTAPRLKDTWQIRSVFIDNLGSSVPIYVYFPATGFTVTAKPNSAAWYPAFTNDRTAWIIGEGFTTGQIPSTLVYFSDALMIPYNATEIDQAVALWRASPSITRGNTIYNRALGTPALGDQTTQYQMDWATQIVNDNVFGTPYAAGTLIVMTNFVINLLQASNVGSWIGDIRLESTGASGLLYLAQWYSNPNARDYLPLFNIQPAQILLHGDETWRIRIPAQPPSPQGRLLCVVNYTVLPPPT